MSLSIHRAYRNARTATRIQKRALEVRNALSFRVVGDEPIAPSSSRVSQSRAATLAQAAKLNVRSLIQARRSYVRRRLC